MRCLIKYFSMTLETVAHNSEGFNNVTVREILEKGIKTERLERVPVGLLNLDESIVDEQHVQDLKESIGGRRGQLSPLVVRARLGGSGAVTYDIIDGFHRGGALKLLKKEFADCKVVYGCDEEEFYDLRVTAALSVSSVSFPRVAKWMRLSYENTEFAKKGLTLLQAISLANQDTSGERFKNFPSEEIDEVKRWVKDKAKKWHKNIGVLYQDMLAVEHGAPDIVEKVRLGRGGGTEGSGTFNPARFKAMVNELPKDYDLQRVVYELIRRFNLDQVKVAQVSKAIKRINKDDDTFQMLMADPVNISEGILSNGNEENPGLNNDKVEQPGCGRLLETKRKKHGGASYSDRSYTRKTPDEILDENVRLKESIRSAHESLERMGNKNEGNPLWFRTIPDLSVRERDAMEMALGEDAITIDEISGKMNLTPNKIIQLLISGHTKYWLSRQDIKLKDMIEEVKSGR